tara:strand:+ start:786 stop:1286 length:501 start_codon:yes stop_codon:yes gene_type:complete
MTKKNVAVLKIKEDINKVNYKPAKDYIVTLVPGNYVHTLWKDVVPFLNKAVERSNGRWSLDALKVACIQQRQELWVIFKEEDNKIMGVATTEFVHYPNSKRLAIQYLGGADLEDWAWSFLKKAEAWAVDNKCHGIECTARFGFWKWLGKSGWDKAYTVFEKRFNNE